MKVLIGTKNPGKIEGARRALSKYFKDFELEGVKVASDVSEQPVGIETYQGALNRVNNLMKYAKDNHIKADLFISVESGLVSELGFWAITNIAVIKIIKYTIVT
jgi:non-canonical (house-cleaning) NTP pyrophosphatase